MGRNLSIVIALLLFVSGCNFVNSGAEKKKEPLLPCISDSKLLAQEPAASLKMPESIFTPRITQMLREGKESISAPYWLRKGSTSRARKWLKIKPERWKELIIEMAPVSLAGDALYRTGTCPLCGKPFALEIRTAVDSGIVNDFDKIVDLINTPFQSRTQCCGKILYAREKDMPEGYPKPNAVEKIPHLDGTIHEYAMYIPKGKENSKKDWFCPEAEVWACRIGVIMRQVIPDLEAAIFYKDDKDCARQLAIILDRIAEIYPGLPLYDRAVAHSIACGHDREKYLTRDEYLSVKRPWKYGNSFYYGRERTYTYCFAKLNYGLGGWHDGCMEQAGVFAEAFDLIRSRPEVKQYSQEKYRNQKAWEEKVMKGLIKEVWLEATGSGDTRGNTMLGWIYGAVKLAIVCGNDELFNLALSKLENYIVNGYFSDGLCVEGAFNYAAMLRGGINGLWMIKEYGGVDVRKRHPILREIEKGDYPVVTVAGVESQHADEHSAFINSGNNRWPQEGNYVRAERSQNYPEYGLVCLRGGAPGHRMENIVAYQVAIAHTHFDRLSLQMFFEGMRLTPDQGYGVPVTDITQAPWKDFKYAYPLQSNPYPDDIWGGYRTYNRPSETHLLVQVDGWAEKLGSCTFHRFQGGQSLEHPAYQVQFWEGSGEQVFSKHPTPVSLYRRQVLTITPPGGRAFLVDLFRVKGGKIHDMYWHFAADDPVTSLGKPKKIEAKNLAGYFKEGRIETPSNAPPMEGRLRNASSLINDLVSWKVPDKVWKATWTIDPKKYNAATPEGRKKLQRWLEILPVTKVNLWGMALGSKPTRTEIVGAKGPFVGRMEEKPGGVGVIAFKDALNYFIERRSAEQPGLESTFVHVAEPYHANEEPYISAVEIKGSSGKDSPTAVSLKIDCQASSSIWDRGLIRVAGTMDGGHAEGDGISLDGRLGVSGELRDVWGGYAPSLLYLYDGTKVVTPKLSVEMEPGWEMKLLAVAGDLTGTPDASALIVESDRLLPTDGTLAGQMLTVYHQISNYHSIGYTIKSIQSWGKDRFRINLQGHPTFIQERMRVREIDKENSRKLFCSEEFWKGQKHGAYKGRRIRFPRSGFECAMEEAIHYPGYHVWGSDLALLAEGVTYTKDQIKVDDPFIVYTIQPGDTVVIPSLFSARESIYIQPKPWSEPQVKVWDVYATGEAKFTIQRQVSHAEYARDEKWIPLKGKSNSDGSYTVYLRPEDLNNGRAVIYLRDL